MYYTQRVQNQPDFIPSSNAPIVEQLDKEEVKAVPRGHTASRWGGRRGQGRWRRNRYTSQRSYYQESREQREYRELEEKYSQKGPAYYYNEQTAVSGEKVFSQKAKPRYKDYSKDAVAVTFYFEDFFNQFPNLNERTKEIIKGLAECTQECLICQNKIYQKTKIWNCTRCAQPYHLGCMKRWIVQVNFGEQFDKESGKSSMQKLKDANVHWSCPNCTENYTGRCPTYRCFCGKQGSPDFSPFMLPHSCGRICERKKHPWCKHATCNVLCHPGQCESCQEMVELSCFCGNEVKIVPCSTSNVKTSCGKKCGRPLNCGKHYCEKPCHEKVQCDPCAIEVKARCYCGKEERVVFCGHEEFGCQKICGKKLECGSHECKKLCHPGDCEECELLPSKVKTCPCGKMQLELLTGETREKCTDSIAICGMPCGKSLPCGLHKCKTVCHVGLCPSCKDQVDQQCRCGSNKRKVDCYLVNYPSEDLLRLEIPKIDTEFQCKKRCDCFKKCHKHKCGRLCCDVVKKYGSRVQDDPEGRHLCDLVCNKLLSCGKHNCPDFCHLGYCKPCSLFSNQPLPCTCGKTVKQPPIACGDGLPYCSYPCEKILPCGHKCGSNCHPGECPPCLELVITKCRCGKDSIGNIQCFKKNLSCGKKCHKELACGHLCSIVCHEPGECLKSEIVLEKGCGQKCAKQKPYCIHRCQELCHPGKPCPSEPCAGMLTIYCECKTRKEQIKCEAFDKVIERELPCNEECKKAERKRALEKFAGTRTDADNPANPDYYPEKMLNLAKHEPSLVRKVEELLFNVILDMNKTGVSLPDMEAEKREIISELVQNNYYLDIGGYKSAKGNTYEVYFNEKARVPKVKLSEAVESYEEKQESDNEPEEIPFEATIRLKSSLPNGAEHIKAMMSKYIYKYYLEKSGSTYYLHFYDKKQAESAYELFKAGAHSFSNIKLLTSQEDEDSDEGNYEVYQDEQGFEYA